MKRIKFLWIVIAILLILPAGAFSQEIEDVKTGLAVDTSIARSSDTGEEAGLDQADSIIVAVTVNKNGKITNCAID